MDVWFDSGTSWTLLHERDWDQPPADVYFEGSDQHRGWFQSSLLAHIAHHQAMMSCEPPAPFKTLITHGFTLDESGRKMSKSLGNVIAPSQITEGTLLPPMKRKKQKGAPASNQPTHDAMGPDLLRLWAASSDYTHDVVIGEPVLKALHQNLHKFRVTFKWLLGALSDYQPSSASVQQDQDTEGSHVFVDKIARKQLRNVLAQIHHSYASYEFFKGISALNRYINADLSAFYFETLKDRLYTGSDAERVPAQAVLYEIFGGLLQILGPITPLLVEEVWEQFPAHLKEGTTHPLRKIWEVPEPAIADANALLFDKQIRTLMSAHAAIKSAQEEWRAAGKMGSSLECDVHIIIPAKADTFTHQVFSADMSDVLANMFVVSKVLVGSTSEVEGEVVKRSFEAEFTGEKVECHVLVSRPSGEKCGRCWRYLELTQNELCGRCEDVVKEKFPEMLA
jgi:isoleucyl-tRNA synthetase